MNLHHVKYTDKNGVKRQQFAASASSASALATELKKTGESPLKPIRDSIEVPTKKDELIDWLNDNASSAE